MTMDDKDKRFEDLMEGYMAGTISDADRSTLFSLIRSSDTYETRYKSVARLYALSHVPLFEAREKEAYANLSRKLGFGATPQVRMGGLAIFRYVAAAVLLLATVSAGSIYMYKHLSVNKLMAYQETEVPLGSQAKIMLPDSSVVILNSGSVLKYPLSFGAKERSVYLAGEGYFEITKDQAKPFYVQAGEIKVKVLGTTFNVHSYLEDHTVEVDLIKGGVEVIATNENIFLSPDEKAIYDRLSGKLQKKTVEASKSALWTTGKLSFVNASFLDILKEIERRFNVKIQVNSTYAKEEFFSGSINLSMSLQEIFNFIDVDKKYQFEERAGVILLFDR